MDVPHRRYNPLSDEWVLVSPHRTQRPWQGAAESPANPQRPPYDPACYLCPGNPRARGVRNPEYEGPYAFDNDFPALVEESDRGRDEDGLLRTESVSGTCRVVCYSPRHDLTLGQMTLPDIERVIRLWQSETSELGARYAWVQIFENHGEAMGASNPHPHGQIWATSYLPTEPAKEDTTQRTYFEREGEPLLSEYLRQEEQLGERIVLRTEHWVSLVPYWATWPFETLLLPRHHVSSLLDLGSAEVRDLASVLKGLLATYDRVFDTDFPFSMGWHGLPVAGQNYWLLHAHFYPPLLRSATVRKHMVGFEMLGEAQRDITPEAAAARLRELLG